MLAPRLQVPASLLSCEAEPVPPVLKTDTDLTDWIINLIEAGRDCRSNLAATRKALGE